MMTRIYQDSEDTDTTRHQAPWHSDCLYNTVTGTWPWVSQPEAI